MEYIKNAISIIKAILFSSWSMLLLCAVLYLSVIYSDLADPDLWGYLAFGRLFWNSPSFPYQDLFSYMPVKVPWIYHEWLTGVVFYPIFDNAGATGLQGIRYLFALLTFGIAGWSAKIRGSSNGSLFLCVFLSIYVFAFGYSPVRAQIFTYLFFAISLYLLESSRLKRRWGRLGWLIPIQILWCNVHGGYVAGIGLILIYVIGEALSRQRFIPYIVALVSSILVTLINPYGFDYWIYTFNAVTMPRPEITEWLSAYAGIANEHHTGSILSFFIIVFFSVLLYSIYHRRDITAGLVLVVTAYLGFSHVRHIVFFALAFMVFMPLPFTLLWGQLKEKMSESGRIKFASALIGVFFIMIIIDSFYTFYNRYFLGSPFSIQTTSQVSNGKIKHHFPVGATNYIKSNGFKGNILPHFDWGEYLIWELYPDCKVGMDGRYETVYPDMVHKAYFNFIYGREGWKEFLYRYPHDMILVIAGSRIHGLLKEDKNWVEAYRGQGTSLFLSRTLLSR